MCVMSHVLWLGLRFTAYKLLLTKIVKNCVYFMVSFNCNKLALTLQVQLHKMDSRIVILTILALAEATSEYYDAKSSYDEKSSYNEKSTGESVDILCNLLRMQ